MTVGLRLHETPAGAKTTILTDSVNPLMGVIMILDVPELADAILIEPEPAEISKSGRPGGVTTTVTGIVCESDLLVPVIVTV